MSYCNGCVYAGLTSQECYSCSCGSNYLPNELEQLKKENEELKVQMGRAGYRIAELKMQIDKMKCCYNCKYGRIYFVKEIIVDCLANKVNSNNKYENCDKWELRK